jgi:YaiO family outer membrane protein
MKCVQAAAAAVLALISAPAIAQQQNAYEAGVAARQAGRAVEAKQLLRTWLSAHPADLDAQLQLAYAELDSGNLDAAEKGFAAVLVAAPDYLDARQGLALTAKRREQDKSGANGFVLAEGSLSELEGAAADWREAALEVQAPVTRTAALGARTAYYRRFGRDDLELTGRFMVHPSPDVWLRANVGGTPHADFRPRFAIGGGGDWRISRGNATVLMLDVGYQRFPLQEVVSFQPGIVQYLASGTTWITIKGIGETADGGPLLVGGSVRGDYQPTGTWRLFGGVANGPDTDLGVVSRVSSVFGGAEIPLSAKLGFVGSVAHEWRRSGADRTEFRIGLKAGF